MLGVVPQHIHVMSYPSINIFSFFFDNRIFSRHLAQDADSISQPLLLGVAIQLSSST